MSKLQKLDREEQHINVYVRIRPFNTQERELKCQSSLELPNNKEVHIKQTYHNKKYSYDQVFDAKSSQYEVYSTVVQPLITEVIRGYNCTVFAYGQTGTGKTYTMAGELSPRGNLHAGIIPRSFMHIFGTLNDMKIENTVRVSYLELYNEELFDLLSAASDTRSIRIFEDKNRKGSVILQGLEETTVKSSEEVNRILEMGTEKRRTAPTLMNASSSRSHTVFTITIHTRETTPEGEELLKSGKLNLVDLAGSENISRSGAVDKRAREAGNINQSLLTLGRVIKALTEKNSHIPYRESKLTRILQDSLGGRTKTSLIATISDANSNLEETLSTLDYAMRARSIQNRPEVNKRISRVSLISQYAAEIEKLQKDLLSARTGTGVYLNEENYSKMLADIETSKLELIQKMNCIRNLEANIQDYTIKLDKVEHSWIEAATTVESLIAEKTSLQKDLLITKEKTEKQEQEIQIYKKKHQELACDTEKLKNEVKYRADVGNTLHRKVTHLYSASYHNMKATKDFHTLYSDINKNLIGKIDQCVSFTCGIISTQSEKVDFIKSTLDESHGSIKESLDQLCSLYYKIYEHKTKYFNEYESIDIKLHDYMSDLTKFTQTNFAEMNDVLFDIKNKQLTQLHTSINAINEEQVNDYTKVFENLITVRTSATRLSAIIFECFEKSVADILASLDKLEKNLQGHSNRKVEDDNYIEEIKKEMDLDLRKLREKYVNKLDQVQKSSTTSTQIICDSIQEVGDIKLQVHDVLETLGSSLSDQSVALVKSFEKPMEDFSLMHTKIIHKNEEVAEKVEQMTRHLQTEMNKSENFYTSFVESLSNKSSQMMKEMTEYQKCFETMSDNWINVNDRCTSAKLTNETTHDVINKVTKEVTDNLNNATYELLSTKNYFTTHGAEMNTIVNDFCNVTLQHPQHVGDTPQNKKMYSKLRFEEEDIESQDLQRSKGSGNVSSESVESLIASVDATGDTPSRQDKDAEYLTAYDYSDEESNK